MPIHMMLSQHGLRRFSQVKRKEVSAERLQALRQAGISALALLAPLPQKNQIKPIGKIPKFSLKIEDEILAELREKFGDFDFESHCDKV